MQHNADLIHSDTPAGNAPSSIGLEEGETLDQSYQRLRRLVRLRRVARALGPAMARPRGMEPLRAAIGAGLALTLCGLVLASAGITLGDNSGLMLIAPLGATVFLLFAVPNSPLAQPWSAIVGNTLSALIAVTVLRLNLPVEASAGIAVCAAIAAMAACRAMHPPGAAMALATVLSASLVDNLGYGFVLMPVLFDTVLLVGFATIYNRLTGRKYPYRQPAAENAHATADPAPDRRLGLTPDDLAGLLARFNLSANIGAEDFGHVLAAAEEEATQRHFNGLTCVAVMSRDVVTVQPDTRLHIIAELFRRHRVKTLPVVGADGRLSGLVTQGDLIWHARGRGFGRAYRFAAAASRLVGRKRGLILLARDIMTSQPRTVSPSAGIGVLVRVLADDGVPAAPVVSGDRLVGIVTRSDLLAVLARQTILAGGR